MDWVELDGGAGEGGGQILRTSLSLSAITGAPFSVRRIRAGRSKPGLRRQHLASVLAVAELTAAEVEGAELGSGHLRFRPTRQASPGEYRFDIGTAGSTGLLFQAVLWPLALAAGPSRVIIEGGTHNSSAPPFDFLSRSFAPLLRGIGVDLELTLDRHGFYPKGGGRITATLPGRAQVARLTLTQRGDERARRARIIYSRLPRHVADREASTLKAKLGLDPSEIEVAEVKSRGPGNAVHVILERERVCVVTTGFGQRGVPAERVAGGAAAEAARFLDSGVAVGEHLSDQLLIPMALAGAGEIVCASLSSHARTNIEVIQSFLDNVAVSVTPAKDPSGAVTVSVASV